MPTADNRFTLPLVGRLIGCAFGLQFGPLKLTRTVGFNSRELSETKTTTHGDGNFPFCGTLFIFLNTHADRNVFSKQTNYVLCFSCHYMRGCNELLSDVHSLPINNASLMAGSILLLLRFFNIKINNCARIRRKGKKRFCAPGIKSFIQQIFTQLNQQACHFAVNIVFFCFN